MEFNYCDGQNRRTTFPLSHPLHAATYVCRCPLQGFEFAPGGFSDNVSVARVFPKVVPTIADEAFQRELEKEHIQRELEKKEIKGKIIANEMAMARQRELEKEVRIEIGSERAFKIPMQRSEGISFNNNFNMFGGSQIRLPSHFPVGNRQASTQINKDKVIQLVNAKPNANHCSGKRKAVTPTGDDNESLQKKVKQEWSCELCQITATSEKGLNDHIQGKKHKAKASMRTQNTVRLKTRRPDASSLLNPCIHT